MDDFFNLVTPASGYGAAAGAFSLSLSSSPPSSLSTDGLIGWEALDANAQPGASSAIEESLESLESTAIGDSCACGDDASCASAPAAGEHAPSSMPCARFVVCRDVSAGSGGAGGRRTSITSRLSTVGLTCM